MKRLCAVVAVLMLAACGSDSTPPETHCYLKAGLYLVYGDTDQATADAERYKDEWPPAGLVDVVFFHYNTDQDLELSYYQKSEFTWSEVDAWLAAGHRVVVVYPTGPGTNHATWIFTTEGIDRFDVTHVFVAGYFVKNSREPL